MNQTQSSETRRVGALDAFGRGCVIEQPAPALAPGMVRVRVQASVISPGTELVRAKAARAAPPAAPDAQADAPKPFGYQNAGVVLDVGEGVGEFAPGDRVACMGSGRALHTDIAVVPVMLCARLPDNVSFEAGAFANLAVTALHAVRRGNPELGEYLLVSGLGLVGQMAARFAQLAGAYVMGWDLVEPRVEVAKRWCLDGGVTLGNEDAEAAAAAFTAGLGFDLAVLAFGGEGTEALRTIKKVMKTTDDTHAMGRLCLVGGLSTTCVWGAGLGNLDLLSCARTGPGYHDKAWETGAKPYPGVFLRWHTRANLDLVLRWMSEGRLDVGTLITHRFPLSRIDEAVDAHLLHPERTLGTVLLMA